MGLIPRNLYGMEPVRCGMSNSTVPPNDPDFAYYSTFSRGLVSAPGVFYNGHCNSASISTTGSKFHFLSAYVTPWKDDVVTFIGHREGDKVARYTSPVLKRDSASPVRLDFGTTFYNIDRLTLVGVEDFSNFVRTSTTCMREGSLPT
jgi:hypothetical protein